MDGKSGAVVLWCDFSKMGKVSGKDLSMVADHLETSMKLRPTMTVGIIMAPILISEKISNNARDEMRRFEDKLSAKALSQTMIVVRMELPPSTKRVPIVYHGWVVCQQATEKQNVLYQSSQLCQDRSGQIFVLLNFFSAE